MLIFIWVLVGSWWSVVVVVCRVFRELLVSVVVLGWNFIMVWLSVIIIVLGVVLGGSVCRVVMFGVYSLCMLKVLK